MSAKTKSFEANAQGVDNFQKLADLFISFRSYRFINDYENQLFDRILPLKSLTRSSGLILYWIDEHSNSIVFKQTDVCKEFQKLSIPIGPTGHVAAVAAYNKGEYLIQNVGIFSRRFEAMHIDRDRKKNSILFFPLLNSKKEAMAVVEIFRKVGSVFTTNDCQYLSEIYKWVSLSLEQASQAIKQRNVLEINQILTENLRRFLNKQNFIGFLDSSLKMMKEVLHAEEVLYFNFVSLDNEQFKVQVYFNQYEETETLNPKLVLYTELENFPTPGTYSAEVFETNRIVNKKVRKEDLKIESVVLESCCRHIESIFYMPLTFNERLYGIAIMMNVKNATTKLIAECMPQQLELVNKIAYYFAPGLHFRKLSNRLHEEVIKLKYHCEV